MFLEAKLSYFQPFFHSFSWTKCDRKRSSQCLINFCVEKGFTLRKIPQCNRSISVFLGAPSSLHFLLMADILCGDLFEMFDDNFGLLF